MQISGIAKRNCGFLSPEFIFFPDWHYAVVRWNARPSVPRRSGAAMQLQLIAVLIIVFLIVMFAVQNAVAVSVAFLLWRVDASLALVIVACFGLGALIGALVTIPTMLRERISLSRLRKQVEVLRAENDDLRAPKKDGSTAPYRY